MGGTLVGFSLVEPTTTISFSVELRTLTEFAFGDSTEPLLSLIDSFVVVTLDLQKHFLTSNATAATATPKPISTPPFAPPRSSSAITF